MFDWFQFTIPLKKDIFDTELLYIDKFSLIKKRIYVLFEYLFNIESKDLFYEERGINGYTQNISYDNIRMYFNPCRWVRTELRFRNEKASELLEYYLDENKNMSLNKFVKGVLHEYIRFLIKNENDTHKDRWETAQWWLKYLENVNKIKFVPRTLEASITRKKVWTFDITSKSVLMCLIADMPNIKLDDNTTDYIYQYIKSGQEKIKDKDIQQINAYRLSKGDLPVEKNQIKDYVRDLKDNLIAMEEITLDDLNKRHENITSYNL